MRVSQVEPPQSEKVYVPVCSAVKVKNVDL
jgi:hypothetical protein